MMEKDPKKRLPTLEETLNQGAERRERELQEDNEPETDVDKLLNEQKRGGPEPPDQDHL